MYVYVCMVCAHVKYVPSSDATALRSHGVHVVSCCECVGFLMLRMATCQHEDNWKATAPGGKTVQNHVLARSPTSVWWHRGGGHRTRDRRRGSLTHQVFTRADMQVVKCGARA